MHQTLALKQSEWNIVVMGNNKYKNQCKRVHFKNVVIETQEKVVGFSFITYGPKSLKSTKVLSDGEFIQ